MSKDAIINGLEKIKSYYMNTNPNKYFSSIKDIISNALIEK